MRYADPTGMHENEPHKKGKSGGFEFVNGGYGEMIEVGSTGYQGPTYDIAGNEIIPSMEITVTYEDGSTEKIVTERGVLCEGCTPNMDQDRDVADASKSGDKKHPTQIQRPQGGGYGYVGVSETVNGVTWFKMSDKVGTLFWVDKDWNPRKPLSLDFWNTDMGKDLQNYFPILQNPGKRTQIGDIGINIFETFFLEKLIRWPVLIPIYVPEEFKNDPSEISDKQLEL
jgi:hypothetical protein